LTTGDYTGQLGEVITGSLRWAVYKQTLSKRMVRPKPSVHDQTKWTFLRFCTFKTR